MAAITVRGYVNKPDTFSNGKYAKFTLSEKQKGRNGAPDIRVYYNVTNWESNTPPADGAFVTVEGFQSVREYEKDGTKRQALEINAKKITVAPPRTGATEGDLAGGKDPWDS